MNIYNGDINRRRDGGTWWSKYRPRECASAASAASGTSTRSPTSKLCPTWAWWGSGKSAEAAGSTAPGYIPLKFDDWKMLETWVQYVAIWSWARREMLVLSAPRPGWCVQKKIRIPAFLVPRLSHWQIGKWFESKLEWIPRWFTMVPISFLEVLHRSSEKLRRIWSHKINIWVCLKMVSTPKPNGFADHYPVF